jgi:flavin reductase (DIM6/NTAB) family NADH-FMN oxidoreductase RutF
VQHDQGDGCGPVGDGKPGPHHPPPDPKTPLGRAVQEGPHASESDLGRPQEDRSGSPTMTANSTVSEPQTFVGAFRRHPAGVAVVTFEGVGGPAGFTATSVTSVSLDPPLLTFAISRASSCWPALQSTTTCVVNLLGADQHEMAKRFAARGVNRFDPPTAWARLSSGAPVLTEAAAWLHCRIDATVEAGDHCLVIALVTDGRVERLAEPLVYHDGKYSTLGRPMVVEGMSQRPAWATDHIPTRGSSGGDHKR